MIVVYRQTGGMTHNSSARNADSLLDDDRKTIDTGRTSSVFSRTRLEKKNEDEAQL